MYMFMDQCTLYNYADDNSLSCIAPTIDAVISNLQSDGNRAIKWFTDNGMQANPEKFQFMMISRDEDSSRSLTLNDSTVIVSEDHVKMLGVLIDSKFNFSLHVSVICNKASRQLNALAWISNYLDVSARRTIYDSFVASISIIALLCGISVELQITASLRKYKKGAYELSTKITNHPMKRCLKRQIRPHLSFQDFVSYYSRCINLYIS